MSETIKRPENKMGVMPVGKLLATMSLPMVISMLVQALYNVVDSLYVAQVSENALTAVSLAFPVQNLMIAVAVGTGVGINALLSKSLGAKDFDEADRAANNGIFLFALSYILFLLFGIFFSGAFMRAQTSITEIVEGGTQYLAICCICSFGIYAQIVFERLLQSTGRTFVTMITQGIGAVINIILDPIFIFGWLGMPKMGVAGAAVATVTGQIIAAALAMIFNLKLNHDIHISFKRFRPNKATIKRIYAVGVPSIIMQAIASIMTFAINLILIGFTPTATAVFGVYFKLQSFVFMPIFGLNNGMVPIVAYNFGAQKRERITHVIRLAMITAIAIMLLGLLIIELFPQQILALFNASPDMMQIGTVALRTISLSYVFAGFCIIALSVFQALGHGLLSMFVSIARQLVVLIPAAFILATLGGLNAVWWAFPIAELMSVSLSLVFFRHVYNKEIKPMGQASDVKKLLPGVE